MRKFKCRPFHDIEVDLDADETYDHLPKTVKELHDRMLKKIGYAYCYFNFLNTWWPKDQQDRVMKLIEEHCNDWYQNDIKILRERVFMFEDEIENMC